MAIVIHVALSDCLLGFPFVSQLLETDGLSVPLHLRDLRVHSLLCLHFIASDSRIFQLVCIGYVCLFFSPPVLLHPLQRQIFRQLFVCMFSSYIAVVLSIKSLNNKLTGYASLLTPFPFQGALANPYFRGATINLANEFGADDPLTFGSTPSKCGFATAPHLVWFPPPKKRRGLYSSPLSLHFPTEN